MQNLLGSEMNQIGMDIGKERGKLTAKRIKRGECPTCGTKVFKVGLLGKKKSPLTVDGKCRHGRCLVCLPLGMHDLTTKLAGKPPPKIRVDDAGSYISGITTEHSLATRSSKASQKSDDLQVRSNASMLGAITLSESDSASQGIVEEGKEDELAPASSHSNKLGLPYGQGSSHRRSDIVTDDIGTGSKHRRKQFVPCPSDENCQERSAIPSKENYERRATLMSCPSDETFGLIGRAQLEIPSMSAKRQMQSEIFFDAQDLGANSLSSHSHPPFKQSVHDPSESLASTTGETEEVGSLVKTNLEESPQTEITMEPMTGRTKVFAPRQVPGCDENRRTEITMDLAMGENELSSSSSYKTRLNESMHTEIVTNPSTQRTEELRPPLESFSGSSEDIFVETESRERKPCHETNHRNNKENVLSEKSPPRTKEKSLTKSIELSSVEAIPQLLRMLKNDPGARKQHISRLAALVWTFGFQAKLKMQENEGMDILSTMIWSDMSNIEIQREVAKLLLALVVMVEEEGSMHLLVGSEGEAVVDALLISMQTHAFDFEMQEVGCQILSCLASSSGNNDAVEDGTRSSAVLLVMGAVRLHRRSPSSLEWSLRALYNQCAMSKNASLNRQVVAHNLASLEEESVSEVLIGLFSHTEHPSLPEWTCMIYSCLAADSNIAGTLILPDSMKGLLHRFLIGCEENDRNRTMEAVTAALVRFLDRSEAGPMVDDGEIVLAAIQFIHSSIMIEPLDIDVCFLILAGIQRNRFRIAPALLDADLTTSVFCRVLTSENADNSLQLRILDMLLLLARNSYAFKQNLGSAKYLDDIVRICKIHEKNPVWQEKLCHLLASVSSESSVQESHQLKKYIGVVCFAMTLHTEVEAVQESACLVLRNLSCVSDNAECLVHGEASGLVVDAMKRFDTSANMQLNGCHILWNLSSSINYVHSQEFQHACFERVVSAIQRHLESTDLIETATATLWCLLGATGDTNKDVLFRVNGALDALSCSIAMHSENGTICEHVVGVFAFVSTDENIARRIIEAEGIRDVIDLMKPPNSSCGILELGALFLRNISILFPGEHREEIHEAVSVLLGQLKGKHESNFSREACAFLWVVATQSESIKAKILSLDGVATLMGVLEGSQDEADVQDVALGAFRELALS